MGVFLMFSNSCKNASNNNDSHTNAGTVTDVDGNVYHTVTIGTQVWMLENLKTTKYNDSNSIQLITDNAEWNKLSAPGYCWYNNDSANKNIYGALYNWVTVNSGKLAPKGWHIPTDAEWTILTTFLSSTYFAGGKMKSTGNIEAGTGLWYTPNSGATNESGFTAVPAGYRSSNGLFYVIGRSGFWWSSSERSDERSLIGYAWYRYLGFSNRYAYRGVFKKDAGFSVRCIRD